MKIYPFSPTLILGVIVFFGTVCPFLSREHLLTRIQVLTPVTVG